MKKHFPCFVLLALTIANLVIPDPLPIIDEAVMAGLTALCFGKRKNLPDDPS